MFEIEFTPEAMDDLKALRKHEQVRILDALETQLRHQPTEATRNRKEITGERGCRLGVADREIQGVLQCG